MKWIHERCLEKWRRTGARVDAAYRCGQCMDHYRDALSIELLGARLQAKRTSGQGTSITLDTLATELQNQGKYDDAEPLFKRSLATHEEVHGREHPDVALAINNLAALFKDQGKYDVEEPL